MQIFDIVNTVLLAYVIVRLHLATRQRNLLDRRRDAREEYFFRPMPELPIQEMERLISIAEASDEPSSEARAAAREHRQLREMIQTLAREAPMGPKAANDYRGA
ncbi:MAG: hypothetical protein WBP60_01090 [Gammaproteobacteria bacterium]